MRSALFALLTFLSEYANQTMMPTGTKYTSQGQLGRASPDFEPGKLQTLDSMVNIHKDGCPSCPKPMELDARVISTLV